MALSAISAVAQNIPDPSFGFEFVPVKNPQKAGAAALLLQYEQATKIETAWETYWQASEEMRSGGGDGNGEVVDRARAARIQYESTRQNVLTEKQREIQSLLQDLALRAKEKAHLEFQPEMDAASAPEEKATVIEKQQEAYRNYFLEDLKSALPAENWDAFEGAVSH